MLTLTVYSSFCRCFNALEPYLGQENKMLRRCQEDVEEDVERMLMRRVMRMSMRMLGMFARFAPRIASEYMGGSSVDCLRGGWVGV